MLSHTNVPSTSPVLYSPPHTSNHVQAFEQPGNGRVLVVDGGGSKRCALLGDNIAEMAHKNGWSVSTEMRCDGRMSHALFVAASNCC